MKFQAEHNDTNATIEFTAETIQEARTITLDWLKENIQKNHSSESATIREWMEKNEDWGIMEDGYHGDDQAEYEIPYFCFTANIFNIGDGVAARNLEEAMPAIIDFYNNYEWSEWINDEDFESFNRIATITIEWVDSITGQEFTKILEYKIVIN